jgi:integrase
VLAYELGIQVAADPDIDSTVVTIQNMTDRHVARWINARELAGSSPKTLTNWHGVLFEVMQRAVEEGLRAANPCARTGKSLPRRDGFRTTEEIVFLDVDEVRLIATAMWPGLPDPDQDGRIVAVGRQSDRDLVLTAVGSGARWGELTALCPSDFALQAARPAVVVNRAWKKNATGEFAKAGVGSYYLGGPKTRAGRRTVRIGDELASLLKRTIKGVGPRDLVFTADRGGMINQPHFYDRRWNRAVALAQKNGLTKSPRFHDLRHT